MAVAGNRPGPGASDPIGREVGRFKPSQGQLPGRPIKCRSAKSMTWRSERQAEGRHRHQSGLPRSLAGASPCRPEGAGPAVIRAGKTAAMLPAPAIASAFRWPASIPVDDRAICRPQDRADRTVLLRVECPYPDNYPLLAPPLRAGLFAGRGFSKSLLRRGAIHSCRGYRRETCRGHRTGSSKRQARLRKSCPVPTVHAPFRNLLTRPRRPWNGRRDAFSSR